MFVLKMPTSFNTFSPGNGGTENKKLTDKTETSNGQIKTRKHQQTERERNKGERKENRRGNRMLPNTLTGAELPQDLHRE